MSDISWETSETFPGKITFWMMETLTVNGVMGEAVFC